jgi:hypothetical protein
MARSQRERLLTAHPTRSAYARFPGALRPYQVGREGQQRRDWSGDRYLREAAPKIANVYRVVEARGSGLTGCIWHGAYGLRWTLAAGPLVLAKFALLGDRENLYLVTIHVDEIAASFTY